MSSRQAAGAARVQRQFSPGALSLFVMRRALRLLLMACAVAAAPAALPAAAWAQAYAQPAVAPGGPNFTADAARDAVREGKHLPLREVVRRVGAQYPGALVDVIGLQDRGPVAVYRLRWRTPDGRLLDINVDAETGAVIR
jgi:hypothetical protein